MIKSLSKLGDIAKFVRGITFKPSNIVTLGFDDSVVCMRTKNVQTHLDKTDLISIPKRFVKREEHFLKEGDILVSNANSWNLVGKCSWVPKLKYEATAGGFISILRGDKNKVDARYLYYWLSSGRIQHNLRHCGRQTTNISNLDFERALQLQIPTPPLLEQRRIAAILDKADLIRRKRQETILLTDEFIRSVFLDMFGNPVTNPKGWPLGSLGEVIHTAKDGPHVSPKYSTTGIPFLSTRHIKCGNIVWEDLKFISLDEAKRQWKKCKPEKGDILYTKGGTTGIATVYDSDREIAVWVHIAILKTNHQKVEPIWLENMLNSKYCYTQSQRYTHGITNQDLGLTRMVKIKMYIPPYKLQREFASGIKKIKQNLSKQQDALFLYDNFFNSLTQCAFRGELKSTEAELVNKRENRGGRTVFFTC